MYRMRYVSRGRLSRAPMPRGHAEAGARGRRLGRNQRVGAAVARGVEATRAHQAAAGVEDVRREGDVLRARRRPRREQPGQQGPRVQEVAAAAVAVGPPLVRGLAAISVEAARTTVAWPSAEAPRGISTRNTTSRRRGAGPAGPRARRRRRACRHRPSARRRRAGTARAPPGSPRTGGRPSRSARGCCSRR